MDTQRNIMIENISDLPNEIEIPEMDENIRFYLKKFVSFSEALQNVHQCFEIFIFNLDQIDRYCTMIFTWVNIKKYKENL